MITTAMLHRRINRTDEVFWPYEGSIRYRAVLGGIIRDYYRDAA